MLKYLKPYTGPAVMFLLGMAAQIGPITNPMLGGVLLGVAFFWLLMSLASDRNLPRRFPSLVSWMPFLASLGETQMFAGRQELEQPYITGKTFRLVDLANLRGVIKEKTVEDCEIWGPAMVLMNASATIMECVFDGPPGAVFVVVSPAQQQAMGVLSFVGHCVFRRCRMQGIAFLGSQAQVDAAQGGFTVVGAMP